MNGPSSESVELFLQEASENLQYLREYSGILQEPQTRPDDLEKLYIAAHTLAGTSASYGFPQFSEVGAKMAHIFHYAMHATLTPDMHGPLTEFISDAISVLEFDLLQISTNGEETTGDIAAFKGVIQTLLRGVFCAFCAFVFFRHRLGLSVERYQVVHDADEIVEKCSHHRGEHGGEDQEAGENR